MERERERKREERDRERERRERGRRERERESGGLSSLITGYVVFGIFPNASGGVV